jgi:hypothetical protein
MLRKICMIAMMLSVQASFAMHDEHNEITQRFAGMKKLLQDEIDRDQQSLLAVHEARNFLDEHKNKISTDSQLIPGHYRMYASKEKGTVKIHEDGREEVLLTNEVDMKTLMEMQWEMAKAKKNK